MTAKVEEQITKAVVEGDIEGAKELTKQALEQKVGVPELLGAMKAGMRIVGDRYSTGEFYIPEMLVGAMAMEAGMELLKPLLAKSGVEPPGTIVAGSVEGDIHSIGKNLVCMHYEGAGFKVINLGEDVSADKFIEAAKENKADLVSMTALISTTRANMPRMVEAIRESGIPVKVMVGGAPLSQGFADAIGADGYAPDGGGAAKMALKLVGAE